MHRITNQPQRRLKIAIGGFERIRIDRQRRTKNHQRCAEPRTCNRLLEAEPSNSLHRHFHRFHDFAELIQRAGHAMSGGSNAATLVVPDMVDNVIAAEIFQKFGARDHVGTDHVVAHYLAAEIRAGFYHALDRLRMRPRHHDHMRGSRLGHHLGFEIATIHCLEISDNGHGGKRFAQGAHAVQTLGKDERGARIASVAVAIASFRSVRSREICTIGFMRPDDTMKFKVESISQARDGTVPWLREGTIARA
jgi:hypothetical protein